MRLALVAAWVLAGCAGSPAVTPEVAGAPLVGLGQEFTLALGGEAYVDVAHFILIFDAVPEDSRCAEGTRCIWEGNARISLTVRGAVSDSRIELNSSGRFAQKRDFEGYVVELRRLEPVRSANAQSPPYAATLLVSPK